MAAEPCSPEMYGLGLHTIHIYNDVPEVSHGFFVYPNGLTHGMSGDGQEVAPCPCGRS